MKGLIMLFLSLTLLGAALTGCAIYPEPIVIGVHGHGHHDDDGED